MQDHTPSQVVAELDKYIIGQSAAKRAVAVALRSRLRRQRVPEAMRDDITPKNIMLIGPTGVGKTEIARRMGMPVASIGPTRARCLKKLLSVLKKKGF